MNITAHFALGLFIRVAFIAFGYIQDSLSEVKYTDVDYRVFTEAAQHVTEGLSPFQRPTYRYTPLVAFLLVPNIVIHDSLGKLLFCIFDVITSALIYDIQRKAGFELESCKMSVFLWLYNPLPIVISTRGSAESLVTFLVVLCIRLARRPIPMGLIFGLAVHFKIYPCIYALSFYLGLPGFSLLPSKTNVLFLATSAIGFLTPTLAATMLYGAEYLQEAILYHLTRKDIRHNFSPFFYALYLLESQEYTLLSGTVSSCGFFLQAVLIALVSWVFRDPRTLPACMFVQTALFVSLNKVCTSQYFVWYLCLLPMAYPLMSSKGKAAAAFLAWAGGQAAWLLAAYCLEFEGRNTFSYVFVSTLVFFSINMYLVCLFIKCVKVSRTGRKSNEIKAD